MHFRIGQNLMNKPKSFVKGFSLKRYFKTMVLSKKETSPSDGMRERSARTAQMTMRAFNAPTTKPRIPFKAAATDQERTIEERIFSTMRSRSRATIKITRPEMSNPTN